MENKMKASLTPYGVCFKIPYKGYEISISLDNNPEKSGVFYKPDVRVYIDSTPEDTTDVTHKFMRPDEYILHDMDHVQRIMAIIDILTKEG
jgi:hypothetical protein